MSLVRKNVKFVSFQLQSWENRPRASQRQFRRRSTTDNSYKVRPEPEVLISPEVRHTSYNRYHQNFNGKSNVFDNGELKECPWGIPVMISNRKWLPKPEILISLKLRQTILKFQRQIWGLRARHRASEKCWQVIATTTDNGINDMEAKTGNNTISKTMTDSAKIPTANSRLSIMTSWLNCSQLSSLSYSVDRTSRRWRSSWRKHDRHNAAV